MSSSGHSGTPLAKKLGIRRGDRVGTFGAPSSFATLVAPLPPGAVLVRAPQRRCEVGVAFGVRLEALVVRFQRAIAVLPSTGGLWVAWPKQASGVETDIAFTEAQAMGLDAGLVDNKICAIDETWSGLRFVVPVAARETWDPPA